MAFLKLNITFYEQTHTLFLHLAFFHLTIYYGLLSLYYKSSSILKYIFQLHCYILVFKSHICEHLAYFQILFIRNNAVINILKQIVLCSTCDSLQDLFLESRITGSETTDIYIFERNPKLSSQKQYHFVPSSKKYVRALVIPAL